MSEPEPGPANASEPVADSAGKSGGRPPGAVAAETRVRPREIGGPSGPEPARYGDWERNGRVSDF